jgi:hypothetical protein
VMLPQAYELPAAIFLLVSGALTCFAGYRLFRIVLAIYGFILGAMLASSIVGVSNTLGMVAAALAGGVVGALILVLASFIGIALVGAGLGALTAHVIWGQIANDDPTALAIALASLAGAIGAMVLQRYVIVVSTAFAGAWTILVGGIAIAGDLANRTTVHAAPGDPWIFYPLSPAPGQRWVPVAWVVLGVIGTAVQLGITGKKR